MKKQLLLLLLLLSSLGSKAQMTLQHSYPLQYGVKVVDLLLSGKKYCLYDTSGIKLYNLNHTLWKTINAPVFTHMKWTGAADYISENLFKIDNKVDMALTYLIPTSPGYSYSTCVLGLVIIDETGSVINRFDTVAEFLVMNIGVDSFVARLVQFPGGTSTGGNYNIYSLPGTLPCNPCGSGPGLGLPINSGSEASGIISSPMPNPSSGKVKIEYTVSAGDIGTIRIYDTMGKEIKSYRVDNTFNYITVDNSELPSGVYYYNLTTSNNQTSAKKMIVVR